MKYIHNEILKPYSVIILQYDDRNRNMHELDKYLTNLSTKGNMYDQTNCKVCDQYFTEDAIRVSTKIGIPTYMQDDMEDKDAYFISLSHEEWQGLLSTLEDKENIKSTAYQIKKLVRQKIVVVYYDIDMSLKVPHKKKARTEVLPYHKNNNKSNTPLLLRAMQKVQNYRL